MPVFFCEQYLPEFFQVGWSIAPQVSDFQFISGAEKYQDHGGGDKGQVTKDFHQGFTVVATDKEG